MQRDLFGNIIISAGSGQKMNWSFSKMQTFRDCPKRYYYQYYGSKKRVAKSEPLKEKLAALAKLSNRYMFQGHLIHLVISVYLKKQRLFESWNEQRLQSFAEKIIHETISYNERLAKGLVITAGTHEPTNLKELQNGSMTAEQLRSEVLELSRICLHHFYTSQHFDHLRKGATLVDARIEGATDFALSESVEVDGKLDLAFWSNSHLTVADWKTGKKEIQDTSLQLLVYVLWAKSLKEKQFSKVSIQKAYLQENCLEELEFSDLHVDRARARILQDADLLLEMHSFGVDAEAEAFTRFEGKNCSLCPFETICHKKQ